MEQIEINISVTFDRGLEAEEYQQFTDSLLQIMEREMTDGDLLLNDVSVMDYTVEANAQI